MDAAETAGAPDTPDVLDIAEAEWIARAVRHDPAAWDAIVRLHQQAVFRLAYLLLGDANDADDVAQETFIRAYRAMDRFDASRPLRPWLLRIASNLSRNRRRSAGRYWAALKRLIWAEPHLVADPLDVDHRGLEAQTLWQAVRRLSRQDQEIIYLRYFLDLSESESAAALDIVPGTVKSRSHRALQRLREVVARDFPSLKQD